MSEAEKVAPAVSQEVIDYVFTNARTHHGFLPKEVPDSLLQEIYNICKWGPNAFNAFPIRIVFVKSAEGKEKLKGTLMEGNIRQTMEAPVTAIIGYDLDFKEKLDFLSPGYPAKAVFESMPALIEPTAKLNSGILGAYFIIAARMKGLDVGPMTGFNNEAVDKAFFEGTNVKSLFMVNLGYGDTSKLYPRAPRLDFEDACKLV